mmetsp:Transcript_136335/g.436282  ORF Transcript_136335/g.436282 Transcript_136335/m.436282 type:complete len:110 (-) Transcript_136335:637-966(-)
MVPHEVQDKVGKKISERGGTVEIELPTSFEFLGKVYAGNKVIKRVAVKAETCGNTIMVFATTLTLFLGDECPLCPIIRLKHHRLAGKSSQALHHRWPYLAIVGAMCLDW